MFIQTEATPNPATLKFLPGSPVLENGSREIQNADEARVSPLASALFAIDGVSGVFFGSDFISVTKSAGEWQHLKPAILGAIMEHFMTGGPVLSPDGAESGQASTEFYAGIGSGLDGVLRGGACGNSGLHQRLARNAGAPGGSGRWRRYYFSWIQGWRGLFADEGRLFRLPVFGGDVEKWHPESAVPFPARRQSSRTGVTSRGFNF